ncbi:MAG: ECF transporter S component [Clostridiales bacterium]|nr:ECF transporter S component [Clostridiales bacterium]
MSIANNTNKRWSASKVAKLAILTAISFIFYLYVKFPLPIFPSFLDIQISELPALIAGFMFGPVEGCVVIILKCLLKMPFSGTMLVGEFGDMLIGMVFVASSSLLYRSSRTKRSAKSALTFGVLAVTFVGILLNSFILIPFYVKFMFGGSWTPLLGMLRPIYPNITVENFFTYYIFLGVIPFNLLRGAIIAVLTFFVYKRVGVLFNKF